jgi:hypothetical protein
VSFAILLFTDVFGPIGKGIGAIPVWFVILKSTDVFGPIVIGMGTKAIGPN